MRFAGARNYLRIYKFVDNNLFDSVRIFPYNEVSLIDLSKDMEATLTVKGQITLPKAVRDALHLKTGDRVLFEEVEEGAYIITPLTTDVQALKGCISYQGPVKTLEEMETAISENAGNLS